MTLPTDRRDAGEEPPRDVNVIRPERPASTLIPVDPIRVGPSHDPLSDDERRRIVWRSTNQPTPASPLSVTEETPRLCGAANGQYVCNLYAPHAGPHRHSYPDGAYVKWTRGDPSLVAVPVPEEGTPGADT